MFLPYSLKSHKTPPGRLQISCLPEHLQDSGTSGSSLLTRVATCRCCWVACNQYGPKDIAEKAPNGIEYELKRHYYDIAGTAYRPAIAALTSLVPTTQILFGSDDPFVPLAETAEGLKQLGFSADDLDRIGRNNALTLLPRLKAS
jgi:Amidohydrolase